MKRKMITGILIICMFICAMPVIAFASEIPEPPTNLQWNTTGTDIVKYGVISWDAIAPYEYSVCVYEDETCIYSSYILDSSSFLVDGRVCFAIADQINETGEYTFTVQAVDVQEVNGEEIYLESEIAVSDSWMYHRPEEELDVPTGLMWEDKIAYWQGVDGTAYYDLSCYEDGSGCAGYGAGGGVIQESAYDAERNLYYCNFTDVMNKTNAVYTFDVRAISTDITQKAHSKVSARSIGHDGTSGDKIENEYIDYGVCGENLQWTLSNEGVLTISGSGPMNDFNGYWTQKGRAPWFSERENIKSLIIMDGVTYIGTYAFSECTSLEDAILPESILEIGDAAFETCINLKYIELPPNLKNINNMVFQTCLSLSEVIIPEGVTRIGEYAFASTAITEMKIPDGVSVIGYGAFSMCESLERVFVSEYVTAIDTLAFSQCYQLKNIEIPKNVTIIGQGAFSFTGITEITIPDGITQIDYGVFEGCRALQRVNIPESVTSIREDAFSFSDNVTIYGCADSYAEIYAKENNIPFVDVNPGAPVEEATSGTFCDNLFWSFDGQGVLTISGSGPMELDVLPPWYRHLDKIETIIIENGITSIGEGAFSYCSNLTNITIPRTVTQIAENAFNECTELTIYGYLNSYAETFAYENNIPFIDIPGAPVEDATSGTFCDNLSWSLDDQGNLMISGSGPMELDVLPPWYHHLYEIYNVVIEDGVTSIGLCAFSSCENLTSITLPDSITTIDDSAFSYCGNLTSIKIPKNVTKIGEDAFYGCERLTIFGYADSCAENYAKANNFPFVYLNPIEPEAGFSNIVAVYPENGKMINFDNPSQGTSSVNYRDAKPRIFFDKEIKSSGGRAHLDFSVGTLEIHRMVDDALVYYVHESISLEGLSNDVLIWSTDSANKAVRLEDVSYNLDAGHSYYVTMPEGFIQFTDGSVSPAIKKGEWIFTISQGESQPLRYLVSYELDGGAGVVAPNRLYKPGDTVWVRTNVPTRAGYEFLGWSDGETLFEIDSTFIMPSKSIVLTAQWKAIEPVELSYVRKLTETSLRNADPETKESIENAIYNLLFKAQFRPTRAEAIVEQKLGMKADYTGNLEENKKWPIQNNNTPGKLINDAVLGEINTICDWAGCMSYAIFNTVYTYGTNGEGREPLKNSKITAETIKNCIQTYVDPGERISYQYGIDDCHAIVYLGESADGTGFFYSSYGGGVNPRKGTVNHSLIVSFYTWEDFSKRALTLGLRDTNGGSYYKGTAQPAKNKVDRIDCHIACPVEATIQLGEEILDSRNIEDGMIVSTSFGSMERQGEVIICSLDYDRDYMVQIDGTGSGTMTFTLEYYADDALVDSRQFVDYPIEEETVITTSGFSPNGAFILYGNLEKDPWGAGINETVYESDIMYSSAYNGPDDEDTIVTDVLKGDVNLDGEVNMDDVVALLNHVVKAEIITDSNALTAGEVTNDTELNMDDVVKLLNYVVKAIDSLD